MFSSFFPKPKYFLVSAVIWIALAVGLWYAGGRDAGAYVGLKPDPPNAPPHLGIDVFWSAPLLWFDLYFAIFSAGFAVFWQLVAPHRWWRWSVLGSALILFTSCLQVEVTLTINNWRGPFFDAIQGALSHTRHVSPSEYYGLALVYAILGCAAVTLSALTNFLASHYIFRWRTAMNDYYLANWSKIRSIEGVSQRIQEDTMRFSKTMEDLAVTFINAVITLLAFLPVLIGLSLYVKVLPIIGTVPGTLMVAVVAWSLFGTVFLATLGFRLPGLYFQNQRAEAAYRKELVFGEDHSERAAPLTLRALFMNVRKNYFRLYLSYVYFNVGRFLYLQADEIYSYVVLGPTVLAGDITFGLMQQIQGAFSEVSASLQYLVNSWSTIVELQSVFKRLRALELAIADRPLPVIESEVQI